MCPVLEITLPYLLLWWSLMFSSKIFILIFLPFIYFFLSLWVWVCKWHVVGVLGFSFSAWISNWTNNYLLKISSIPNFIAVYTCPKSLNCFWTSYSVPLAFLFVLVMTPHWYNYCSFTVDLDIWCCKSFSFIFSFLRLPHLLSSNIYLIFSHRLWNFH